MALQARALETIMLTGDGETAARAIAAQAGKDDIRFGLQPEEKVTAVRALARAARLPETAPTR
ncbi:MAG: HAD family hydrolase [Notoacmeibacter sp.]|nr:HAD family hydrolase [Notoacmeibacter sp.]